MASEKESADPRKDVDDAYKATHFLGPIDDGLHDVVRPFQAEITLVSTPYFSTIGLEMHLGFRVLGVEIMKPLQWIENYVSNHPARVTVFSIVLTLLGLIVGGITLFDEYFSTVSSSLKSLFITLIAAFPNLPILPILLEPIVILGFSWAIILLVLLLFFYVLYVLARIGLGKLENYLFERLSDRVDLWLQKRVLVIREAVLEHLERIGDEPEQQFFWGGQICLRTGYYKTVFGREVVRMKIEEGREFPYVLSEGKEAAATLWQFIGP